MKIYDISVTIDSCMPNWPEDPGIEVKPAYSHEGGSGFHLSRIHLHSHAGTHVDAPFHLMPEGLRLSEIPTARFILSAEVVEYPDKQHISGDFVRKLNLPQRGAVLFKTSNSRWWRKPDEPFHREFVALDQAAGRALVEKKIALAGIDYFSIDPFESTGHDVHRLLLQNDILILENLDLRMVPAGRYQLVWLPMKLVAPDGAPVRAVLTKD